MGGPSGEIEMVDARDISSKQKQIAVSEFFEKNKHFLGFDSLQRSLITAVKEAVDNSLDACEEARILPEINVEINRLKGDDIELISQDNGPGIPRDAIENVFGKFLLGSRFHAIRQTRGQQGIGITGVVMYSQLTTGAKTRVISKIKNDSSAVFVELGLDTRKNKAIKSKERREIWIDQNTGEEVVHGLKIATIMKAKYQRGKQSVFQYLRMTSIVNPHATISLTVKDRDGEIIEEARWIRTSERLPRVVEEIKPIEKEVKKEMPDYNLISLDTLKTVKQDDIYTERKIKFSPHVHCEGKVNNQFYLSATGNVFPCKHVALNLITAHNSPEHKTELMYSWDKNSISKHTLEDIFTNDFYKGYFNNLLKLNPLVIHNEQDGIC